jgi:hypothetical protein
MTVITAIVLARQGAGAFKGAQGSHFPETRRRGVLAFASAQLRSCLEAASPPRQQENFGARAGSRDRRTAAEKNPSF